MPSSPFSSVPTKPRMVEARRPAVSTRCPVSSSFRPTPIRPRLRHSRGGFVRNLTRYPNEPEVPVVQRRERGRSELSEDPLELGCGRGGVDDLARYGVDALRRQRAHEHVPVAIEDVSAPREDFHGVGALQERLFRVDRSFKCLNVAEPPRKKERDGHAGIKEDSGAHRSDARKGPLMHKAPCDLLLAGSRRHKESSERREHRELRGYPGHCGPRLLDSNDR